MIWAVRPGFGITTTIIGIRIRMSALTSAEFKIIAGPASWQKITS
jgi:hypothetical protein